MNNEAQAAHKCERRRAPLPNRVDPQGGIHSVVARGLFTGNRGVLHDPDTRELTGRRWTTKAWITCRLDYGDRRRDVMGRNGKHGRAGWTELFFLDEVTALAAGHRPCFFCRRKSANAFAERFPMAGGRAPAIDQILHGERVLSGLPGPLLDPAEIVSLPDGAMLASDSGYHAVHGGLLRQWRFEGWSTETRPIGTMRLVTPRSTVAALAAGFSPIWHPSIGNRHRHEEF